MEYYRHEKINEHLIRIIDFLNDCCYLVIGEQRAVLLDTLNGFGNIKEYASQFTDKEIFVILSHGHIDHGSGACFFDTVYLNSLDIPLFNDSCSAQNRLKNFQNHPIAKNIPIKDMAPLYEGPLLPIEDYQCFDLGGITIKMLPIKGHTMGMMVPLLIEDRIAVFGDACGVGVLLIGEQSTTISEYKNSLLTLKSFESEYDTILRNHGTFSSSKELLDNVIECCDDVLSGHTSGQSATMHGMEFFIAKAVDEHDNRIDGKQGNIKYMAYNAR